MPPGRVLHVSLDLLDRQLRDRQGRLCGNVDDLELEWSQDGELMIAAILSGSGALAHRLGAKVFGRWMRTADQRLHHADRSRIPIELAGQIGPTIDLAIDAEALASHTFERWTSDHIVSHVPGSGHRARR